MYIPPREQDISDTMKEVPVNEARGEIAKMNASSPHPPHPSGQAQREFLFGHSTTLIRDEHDHMSRASPNSVPAEKFGGVYLSAKEDSSPAPAARQQSLPSDPYLEPSQDGPKGDRCSDDELIDANLDNDGGFGDSDPDFSSDDDRCSNKDGQSLSTRVNLPWDPVQEQHLLAWRKEGKPWKWIID